MNSYFARLNPLERRFVVGVMVIVFIVLNLMFVWPHRTDWQTTKTRLDKAQQTIQKFDGEIAKTKTYEGLIKSLGTEGAPVPPEDQDVDFIRAVQTQAAMNGVTLLNSTRMPPKTNDQFFVEKALSATAQGNDKELVNFLFSLGEGESMIRVRDLALRTVDASRFRLSASIKLVASYQKKAPVRATAAPAARTNSPASAPKPTKPKR